MTASDGAQDLSPEDALTPIRDSWVKLWEQTQTPTPDRLYHYTSGAGLLGILRSQRLWASDVRFMNDATELSHSLAAVTEVVQQAAAKSEASAAFLEQLPLYFQAITSAATTYVTCFCEDGDLLSQWRGYGSFGNAFSIGLDATVLDCSVTAEGPRLKRVIYDRSRQQQLLTDVLEQVCDLIDRAEAQVGADKAISMVSPDCVRFFGGLVGEIAFCFKNDAFSEEREWRLVWVQQNRMPPGFSSFVSPMGRLDQEFRVAGMGLVPYVELKVPDSLGEGLPIREVVVGPSNHRELAWSATESLLRTHGYGGRGEVRSSAAPWRG